MRILGRLSARHSSAISTRSRLCFPATKRACSLLLSSLSSRATVAHYEAPRTPAEGRFSLKYVVATALTHGSVRLAAFEPQRLNDPATRALMKKMSVELDPQLDAAFPRQRAARVRIELEDGRSEEFLQPTRKGDPDMPLSDAQLEEKFLELAGPVLGAKARQTLDRLWRLETQATLA